MSAIGQPPSSRSSARFIPWFVVVTCLPLPIIAAVGALAFSLERMNEALATLLNLAFFFGYLVLILPAMWLIEPFAIIATIWYTARADREAKSVGRVLACWLAVAVHTSVMIWFLVNASRR